MLERTALIKAPSKSVFPFLWDVTSMEEYTQWRITPLGDEVGEGFQWRESKGFTRRLWTVTAFDRRGLTMSATWKDLTLTLSAKKGGTASSIVYMRVTGSEAAVAKFEKTDGDRLDRFKSWLGA